MEIWLRTHCEFICVDHAIAVEVVGVESFYRSILLYPFICIQLQGNTASIHSHFRPRVLGQTYATILVGVCVTKLLHELRAHSDGSTYRPPMHLVVGGHPLLPGESTLLFSQDRLQLILVILVVLQRLPQHDRAG